MFVHTKPFTHKINWHGRRGTAVMPGGWKGPNAGGWFLVPSYCNDFGGKDYDWNNVLPTRYKTKKEAATARKEMRLLNLLP